MPLSPVTLASLRGKLEARAAELRRELGATLHDSGERADLGLPNRNAEVDDAAVAENETLIDIASVQRDARELQDVTEALARLDGPDYGTCADCGEPIAVERLEAQPQARRCIACERSAERRAQPPRPIGH